MDHVHALTGTAIYCAPELLRSNYSFKSDVWSAGVIVSALGALCPWISIFSLARDKQLKSLSFPYVSCSFGKY